MYTTISGKVEAISKTRNGIKIDGYDWLNNKFKTVDAHINVGDVVDVSAKDGKFWNKIMSGSGGAPTTTAETHTQSRVLDLPVFVAKERAIIRQNALTHATAIVMGSSLDVKNYKPEAIAQEVIDTARQLEAYASGQIDRYELDKAVEEAVEEAN